MSLIRQILCKHDFKFTGQKWCHEGDILKNQYTCTKCGRHDYLYPEDDPLLDWNGGKGDGKICNIFRQQPSEDL